MTHLLLQLFITMVITTSLNQTSK